MSKKSAEFGTAKLSKILRTQAIPASIGILVLSIYGIVDTIFIGKWIDVYAIGAVTVVLPLQFLLASVGMAIGVGGSSIISRSLGLGDKAKANKTFTNQVLLVLTCALFFFVFTELFSESILRFFGASGLVYEPAYKYFKILLYGIPFLTWAMMSNTVIRAEGYPKTSMVVLLIPALMNLILDPILIIYFDMGIEGAAWATTISFIACGLYAAHFFVFGKSELKIDKKNLRFDRKILGEIASLGSVTLARQGAVSMMSVVLNNSLIAYGGEFALGIYGILNRVIMFANFPVLGITQGFVPIAGYNYGAKLYQRTSDLLKLSMKSATMIAFVIFCMLMVFTEPVVSLFTNDAQLIKETVPAMRMTFLATPLVAISFLVSAYYQAIGRAIPGLLLALCKQGFFLIPLVLIMPMFFGLKGIWLSFPIADVLSAGIGFILFKKVRGFLSTNLSESKLKGKN
jgi:putative MATE family efflux protein